MPPSLDYDDRPRRRRARPDRTALWVVLGLLGALSALLLVAGAAVLLWVVMPARKAKPVLGAPQFPDVPAAPVPAGWREFRSAEGRFRVLLPGRPAVRKQRAPSPAGPVLDTVCELNTDEMSVGVRFADFDGPNQRDFPLEQVVTDGRDSILRALGGRVSSERAFNLGDVRVREAVIDSARQGRCHFRWYVRGRRLYAVTVMSVKRDWAPPADVVRRVFDSFQLTD
jgi:hypothetical protein